MPPPMASTLSRLGRASPALLAALLRQELPVMASSPACTELTSLRTLGVRFHQTAARPADPKPPCVAELCGEDSGEAPQRARAAILDGRAVAATWQEELAREAQDVCLRGGRKPSLGVVLVGDRPDSLLYVTRKAEACQRVGIRTEVRHLPATATQQQLAQATAELCADPRVDGVLVQLPLPAGLDEEGVIEGFDPAKDVDGFHPLNVGRILMRGRAPRFVPCTALGCMQLLQRSGVAVRGRSAVVLGDSNIVGMPLAMLLRDAGASNVTVVHRASFGELFADARSGQVRTLCCNLFAQLREYLRRVARKAAAEEEPVFCLPAAAAQRAEQRAQAEACLPRIPGPMAQDAAGAPRPSGNVHPYRVDYASAMQQAYAEVQQQQQQQQEEAAAARASEQAHGVADLSSITRTADILVVAVGYPQLVKAGWVKPGAVVLDVGINVVGWGAHPSAAAAAALHAELLAVQQHQPLPQHQPLHVVGDVDFCEVVHVASAVTPVPGGVGPMTIAAVLHNTIQAAKFQLGLESYSPASRS